MAWTTPTNRTTGEIITAAIYNTDLVDNLVALRAGSAALTNQVNGRFVVTSSTTQHSVNKNAFVKIFMEVFG